MFLPLPMRILLNTVLGFWLCCPPFLRPSSVSDRFAWLILARFFFLAPAVPVIVFLRALWLRSCYHFLAYRLFIIFLSPFLSYTP